MKIYFFDEEHPVLIRPAHGGWLKITHRISEERPPSIHSRSLAVKRHTGQTRSSDECEDVSLCENVHTACSFI